MRGIRSITLFVEQIISREFSCVFFIYCPLKKKKKKCSQWCDDGNATNGFCSPAVQKTNKLNLYATTTTAAKSDTSTPL